MQARATFTARDGAIALCGAIDFTNVVALEEEGADWLRDHAPARCRVDLADVSDCNSAIAALLLSWMRTAQAAGKHIELSNLPAALEGVLQLAGLEGTLNAFVAVDTAVD